MVLYIAYNIYKHTIVVYIYEVCYHLNGTVFLKCDLDSLPDRIQWVLSNKAFSIQINISAETAK